MNKIVSFITENYRVLILLAFNIVTFVILLCKKKVKIHDTFEIVLLTLPDLINEAESLNLEGSDKFGYVFNKCVGIIKAITHAETSLIVKEYSSLINEAIENILSTPQKKER